MDRCALFVDAGHLLAEGGKACCGTRKRARIRCDFRGIIQHMVALAAHRSTLPVLRTYWYDGARDGVPTVDHQNVADLANVKVRLGRLSGGRQKGVDALIYRDLMTLARERAIAAAFLVAGDEDLREGVAAAQDMGVQVTVIGIRTGEQNQAPTLVREADEAVLLGARELRPFFSKVPRGVPERKGADIPAAPPEKVGAAFAAKWLQRATGDQLASLLAQAPGIPRELDAQLVTGGRAQQGINRNDPEDQRFVRSLRRGFWNRIHEARREHT